jgi:hypothetical protein
MMGDRYNPTWRSRPYSDWRRKRREQALKHLFYACLVSFLAAVTILYVGTGR